MPFNGKKLPKGQRVLNDSCTIPLFGKHIHGDEVRFQFELPISPSRLNANTYNPFKFVRLYTAGFGVFDVKVQPVN